MLITARARSIDIFLPPSFRGSISQYAPWTQKTAHARSVSGLVLPTQVADVVGALVEPKLEASHVDHSAGQDLSDQFYGTAPITPPEGDGLELPAVRCEYGVLLGTVFAGAVVEEEKRLVSDGQSEPGAERPRVGRQLLGQVLDAGNVGHVVNALRKEHDQYSLGSRAVTAWPSSMNQSVAPPLAFS